ncbi:hypothetical protein KKF84_02020 [Myxococcota bacterium]|nr:hypothetical protein [Myxococcota bacterium]
MIEKAFLELTRLEGVIGGVLFTQKGEILLMQLPSIFSFDIVMEAVQGSLDVFSVGEGEGAISHLTAHYEFGRLHLKKMGNVRALLITIQSLECDLVEIGFNLLAACLNDATES